MNETVGRAPKSRHAYERPRVFIVKLAEDEAVLRTCKTVSGSGNGPLGHCRQPDKCYTYGS